MITSLTRAAVVMSSVLFGLWHVLPSLNLADVNPVFEGLLGTGLADKFGGVAIAVVGTFLVGQWLCFLRYRSGSILAPVIVHTEQHRRLRFRVLVRGSSDLDRRGNVAC